MLRDREEFPFWRVAAAVMVGNLLAAIVIWFAIATWARYEAKQLADLLQVEAQRMEAESIRRQQANAVRQAKQRRAAEAQRDAREGRPLRAATPQIPMGELACLSGRIARREANGWQQQFDSDGQAIKCRSRE
jgi:hypothetical protein